MVHFLTNMDIKNAFIQGLWKSIPSDSDVSWVHNLATLPASDKPCGDLTDLVRKMISAGISKEDVARFAKITAYDAVFSMCYYLDDYFDAKEFFEPGFDGGWGLFETNEEDLPIAPLGGLHEMLISGDPSGREMRPPSE